VKKEIGEWKGNSRRYRLGEGRLCLSCRAAVISNYGAMRKKFESKTQIPVLPFAVGPIIIRWKPGIDSHGLHMMVMGYDEVPHQYQIGCCKKQNYGILPKHLLHEDREIYAQIYRSGSNLTGGEGIGLQ